VSATPKTIQIFLPTGAPRGLRIAELTTSIVRVFEVPRSQLADFLAVPEAAQVGVYYLVGEGETDEQPRLYIGQSGELVTRLKQQNNLLEFWNRALAVVSLTNSLTQTHAGFLEWLSIQEAGGAGRYRLENGNAGSRPHTPPPLEADCREIFTITRTLVATLGFPLFEPLRTVTSAQARRIYTCIASGTNAIGEYTADGFIVLKGSKARMRLVDSVVGTALERTRQKLIDDGVLVEQGGMLVFTRDYAFGSPSMAAAVVTARTANGWVTWMAADGRTLDDVERKALAGVELD
jgi:hypothetical protein